MSNSKGNPSSRSSKSESSCSVKNAFWFLVYLLGACLTLKSCLGLLNEYSSAPIHISVTANMTKMVPLPNITVCMPFDATQMFPFNTSSETPYSDSIEYFFSKTIENGTFDATNYIMEWYRYNSRKVISNETLFILHKYLTIMHEAEYLREEMQNPFTSFSRQAKSDQESALLNILVPRIQQMKIATDEIKNIFLEYFKIGSTSSFGMDDERVFFCILRGKYDNNMCDFFDTISYLDHNQICFKMHNIILQADDESSKYIKVAFNDPSEAIKMSGRKIIFNFNGDATPPDFAAAADESSIVEMMPDQDNEIYIDYQSVYRTLPLMLDGRLRCSYHTRRECEEKCRIDLIKEKCGCAPITFSTGRSNESKCTFAHYEKCLNYAGNEDEECRRNCPVSCEQTNYKISKPYINNGYDSASLKIVLNKYDYFVYEEYYKFWTVLDLIYAIGGVLGIWLGTNFIALIRFIFTIVAMVYLKVSSMATTKTVTIADQFNFTKSLITNVCATLKIEIRSRFTPVSLTMWMILNVLLVAIYLVSGVFTAKVCFELFEQYASSQVKTSMQVTFNKSISLPPATLCLRHNLYYYNINPSFEPSSKYTDALSEYLNQRSLSKESILQYGGDHSTWPSVMTFIAYKYLSVLHYYEYHNEDYGSSDKRKYPINEWQKYLSKDLLLHDGWADEYCSSPLKNDSSYYNSTSSYDTSTYSYGGWYGSSFKCQDDLETAHDRDCSNAIETVLIPKLTEFDITVEELRQKTLYQLNSDARLTFRFLGLNTNTIINNLRATAFGLYSYCMLIPLDNFEFTSEKDYAEIAIESNKILYEEHNDTIIFTFDATFADLGGSITPNYEESREQTKIGSTFQMAFGESKSFSSRINYKIALDSNSPKCSNFKNKEEMDILYRIQYIEELCNCSPTSWLELLPSTSRICTLQEYKSCLIFDERSWFYNNRFRTSRLPCEMIKMDISESDIGEGETNTRISRIRIGVEDFVYLTTKEEMAMTFRDLVVAFGGTLAILLDLDFCFIAWLIFTPPFALIAYLLEKLLKKTTFFSKPMRNTILKSVQNTKLGRLIATIFNVNLSSVLKLNRFALIKKLIENVYWLFVHAIRGILIYFLVKSVVIDYMRNNNPKVLFVPMNNEFISLPSPTICLPFHPLKIGSDHGQSDIDSTNFVQNYLSGKTKMDLLEDEWDPAFINHVHSYIVQYGKYEWFALDDFPNNIDHPAFFDTIDNMVNVLAITFEELREKLGRKFAKMYYLNIAYYANTLNEIPENLNIHTVFVEESKVCYKPLMESLTFNTATKFLNITANGDLMRKFGDHIARLAPITIDLNGRYTTKKGANILDATVSGSFGLSTTIALEIDTVIKAQPVVDGERHCSNLLSLDQCRSSCVAEAIQDTCKCLPRTITLTTSSNENAQFCTLADYKQCSLTLQSDAFSCLDACLEPCERIRFSTGSSITRRSFGSQNDIEVYIGIGSFKYQYIEEQYRFTIQELIIAYGGALGVFLGLNVLVFIKFFYALLVRLFAICVTRKWAKVQPVSEQNGRVEEFSI